MVRNDTPGASSNARQGMSSVARNLDSVTTAFCRMPATGTGFDELSPAGRASSSAEERAPWMGTDLSSGGDDDALAQGHGAGAALPVGRRVRGPRMTRVDPRADDTL